MLRCQIDIFKQSATVLHCPILAEIKQLCVIPCLKPVFFLHQLLATDENSRFISSILGFLIN